jgi:hypothetical protein
MADEEADFSDEFCQFLQSTISAVEAAELLLALRREPERWWTPADALAAVNAPEGARYLDVMRERGVIAADAQGRVQYRPQSEALTAHARTLEKVYRERPVTLIRVIYGLRDSKIRSFADAFRLRRK